MCSTEYSEDMTKHNLVPVFKSEVMVACAKTLTNRARCKRKWQSGMRLVMTQRTSTCFRKMIMTPAGTASDRISFVNVMKVRSRSTAMARGSMKIEKRAQIGI